LGCPFRKGSRIWGLLLVVCVGVCLACLGETARAFSGTRALGMGGAYTAVADDAAAVFWNPAGLLQVKTPMVATTLAFHAEQADSYEGFVSYVEPDSGYGAGALSWYYGRLDPVAYPDGVLYTDSHDFSYALAKSVSNQVVLGGSICYQRRREPGSKTSVGRWTGDIAGMMRLSNTLQAGITMGDVYGILKDDDGGKEARGNMLVGLAFQPDKALTLALDGHDVLNRLGSRRVCLGGEYRLPQGLALRAGLQRGIDNAWEAWTWGAGIDIASWRMEYAYLGGDYHGIHTMGITWRF